MTHLPTAPQIGFDRYIRLDWVALSINVRAGSIHIDQVDNLLSSAGLGKEAKAKTRTKLNALGIEPRADLVEFIDRGVGIFNQRSNETLIFAWGAAIASYPFFGKVAEFTGRLFSIQGDCAVAEIHRRMSEVYGDREVTKRATQAVIQTQSDWGAIERVEKGKRLIQGRKKRLQGHDDIAWLVEACVRYSGRSLSVASLDKNPIIYPFELGVSLPFVLSKSGFLELSTDSMGNQVVNLKSGT